MALNKNFLGVFFAVVCVAAAVTVATDHFDNSRTGWNPNETSITPTILSTTGRFAALGTYVVDGAVWAEPLYTTGVTISSVTYNLLVVATMHCTVYGFNADAPGSTALW